LPEAYHSWLTDPRLIADHIRPLIGPGDLLVSVGVGDSKWSAGAKYMILSRYLRLIPCPVAFINGPPDIKMLAAALRAHQIFVLSDTEDAEDFFPPAKHKGGQMYQGFGLVWLLQPPQGRAP
jgi:hypothetical protein